MMALFGSHETYSSSMTAAFQLANMTWGLISFNVAKLGFNLENGGALPLRSCVLVGSRLMF